MGTLLTILITAAIAGWFGYSLYRMWRGASGRDCASCALGAGFDYALYNDKKAAPPKRNSSPPPATTLSWMKQPPGCGENGSGK